jgi:hypothetical protein
MNKVLAFYNTEAEAFTSAFAKVNLSALVTEEGQREFTLALMGKGVGKAKARTLTAFAVEITKKINENGEN